MIYHFVHIQLSPDKEMSLIFAVFDENRSWYFDENMKNSQRFALLTNTSTEFYNSNVIYSRFLVSIL